MFDDLFQSCDEVGRHSFIFAYIATLDFIMVEIQGSSHNAGFFILEGSSHSFVVILLWNGSWVHLSDLLEYHDSLKDKMLYWSSLPSCVWYQFDDWWA
jgi:hypothetical protein